MNIISNVSSSSVLEHKLHRFEIEPPITAEEAVRDQMQLASIYFSVLLEIEQERKSALRKASPKFAELADLEANMLLIGYEIQDLQNTINKSDKANEQILTRIAYLRTSLRTAKNNFRDLKNEIKQDEELTAVAAQIDQMAREKIKFARKNSGVYWGTYLMVEASVSKKESVASSYPPPMDVKIKPSGTVINFNRKKDFEGRVGIRMQNPLSVKEVYKCLDSRFRLESTPAGVHAWLRVGSNPDNIREPIWAIFPVQELHLRNDALVTAVNVTNVVRGGREKWFLDVWTLEGAPKRVNTPKILPPPSRKSTLPPVLGPAMDVLKGRFQQPVLTAQRLVRRLLPKWVTQGDHTLEA